DRIFKDVDSIPYGADFRERISEAVGKCNTVLVMIGPHWLTAELAGKRRLEDPNDWVRVEVQMALAKKLAVIPGLVKGAGLPQANDLPEGLAEIAFRQAACLRNDPDFSVDMERLLKQLNAGEAPAPSTLSVGQPPRKTASGRIFQVGGIALLGVALLTALI